MALANAGDPGSVQTLIEATAAEGQERVRAASACLLLAERLTAAGRKADAAKVYEHLPTSSPAKRGALPRGGEAGAGGQVRGDREGGVCRGWKMRNPKGRACKRRQRQPRACPASVRRLSACGFASSIPGRPGGLPPR